MPPDTAATRAEVAADIALKATGLAIDAKKEAERHAQAIEKVVPDTQKEIIRELASREGGALLSIGPKRNRWRDLQRIDQQLAEFEIRREQLSREIGETMAARANEADRLAAAVFAWFASGNEGSRPQSQATILDEKIQDLQAEHAAVGLAYNTALGQRVDLVTKRRKTMVADVTKELEAAAGEYLSLVEQAEAKREEVLALRQTQLWCSIFPSEVLANEPSAAALVGAKKRLQEQHLPGLQSGLVAASVFALMKADVRFCSTVATAEQAAAERGVTIGELTNSEAKWMDNSKVDLVGPRFDSAWGGSDEEKAQAQRIRDYQEQTRRRMEGE